MLVDNDALNLNSAVRDLAANADQLLALVADAAKWNDTCDIVAETVAKWKRVDILVNNVGGSWATRGFDLNQGLWNKTLALNLSSAYFMTRAVYPIMSTQREGRIINISSSAGRYRGNTGSSNPAYAAAKAGLLQLTRTAACALGPFGVTVNAIAPGLVLSRTGAEELRKLDSEVIERVKAETPLGYFAHPDEIARITVFLACDKASYITGATIMANGGWCTS
jgi:NAD(P)-dependent dehydrogenase (short-subunit alcohol dehydrogenase family)